MSSNHAINIISAFLEAVPGHLVLKSWLFLNIQLYFSFIVVSNDKNYQLLRINTFSDDMNDIPLETTILNNEQMMPTDVIATTRQEKGIYICLIRLNDQKSFRHH